MSDHDDAPPVPPMSEALVSEKELLALARDLTHSARVVSVRVKAAARSLALPESVDLSDAIAHLMAGDLRAVQIHYVFLHQEWADTIIRDPSGFRLTRCLMAQTSPS